MKIRSLAQCGKGERDRQSPLTGSCSQSLKLESCGLQRDRPSVPEAEAANGDGIQNLKLPCSPQSREASGGLRAHSSL